MNICINIFGQIKYIEYLKKTIETNLYDNNNTFHILYTTWTDTNIEYFTKEIPNAYIKQYEYPDLNVYKDIINNYKLDITQPKEKNIERYIFGFYIKSKSYDTIIDYENTHNIKFDIIITIRTYTKIYNNNSLIQSYYSMLEDNIIYTAQEPSYAIYSMPAYPDSFVFSKRKEGLDILNVFDVLEKSTINNTNMFHPETSAYSIIINKGYNICKLPFNAIVYY